MPVEMKAVKTPVAGCAAQSNGRILGMCPW
jgi:hypothetical protein